MELTLYKGVSLLRPTIGIQLGFQKILIVINCRIFERLTLAPILLVYKTERGDCFGPGLRGSFMIVQRISGDPEEEP